MNKNDLKTITLDLIGISTKYQGGATIFAQSLLREFIENQNHRYQVILPISEKGNYPYLENVQGNVVVKYFTPRDNLLMRVLHRISTRILKSPSLLAKVQKFRWREAIRYVELNSDACLTLSTYINFPLSSTSHICTLHDIQEKSFKHFFSKSERLIRNVQVLNTLRHVTGVQVSSKFVRDEIVKYYPMALENVNFHIIPEGFSRYEVGGNPPTLKKSDETIQIIYPANFWPHKDHKTFFKTLVKLNTNFKIKVFCTGTAFEKQNEIESMLSALNLDNVTLTGYLSRHDLMNLYRESHIVISCSMYESSSLPILEGAALGCVPIASNIPPHIEMSNYLKIELFEVGNEENLERVITNVIRNLDKTPNLYALANQIVVENLSWKALIPMYTDALLKNKSSEIEL